jgi:glycosyltransferase involved in cell wall biosynthesis
MKISVITVCFNSAKTIKDTLDSVNGQTHPNIEHIIVDGGSLDSTLSLVKAHGRRVTRLVSERDRGIYDAMNKGLFLATGDVVGILNSDDCYGDTRVLEHVAATMQDPSVDACFGDLELVNQRDINRVIRYWKPGPYIAGACAKGWMPPHPTFYVRRQAYERYGGFDLSFPMAADFEMSLRLLEVAKLNSTYIPEVLVRMRTGGASNRGFASIVRNNRETSKACIKHGLPGGILFLINRMLVKLPEIYRRRKSKNY